MNDLKGKALSLWQDTTPETEFPELQKDQGSDVVIIGGGLAGITAAYYLTKKGKKVTILEAFRIATGTSGNTTAKLSSLHGLMYDYLIKTFGIYKAKIYARSNEWAIRETEKIIKEEKIECDYKNGDAFTYTNDNNYFEKIKKEVDACQKLGLPAVYEENINSYFPMKAAIKMRNQGQYHPRKFLLQLAKIIIKNGGTIYENTRALDINEGDPNEIITDKGHIKAKEVIIATNYPFYDKGMFFSRMDQWRSYAYGIKIDKNPSPDMFIGVGKDWLSIRSHREGSTDWLIVGGESHPAANGGNAAEHYKNLEKLMYKFLPVKSINYRWASQDSSPIDHVPYIGKENPMSKHIYIITGFYKWGLTKSIIAAQIMSDLIEGRNNEWLELYNTSRIKVSPKKLVEQGKQVARGYLGHIKKNKKDKIPLKINEGKVIDKNGEKIGVYRDEKGLHAVSAVCTHMGCIVEWNSGDLIWDCPCHGSQYSKDGKVLRGPAVKNLAQKDV